MALFASSCAIEMENWSPSSPLASGYWGAEDPHPQLSGEKMTTGVDQMAQWLLGQDAMAVKTPRLVSSLCHQQHHVSLSFRVKPTRKRG